MRSEIINVLDLGTTKIVCLVGEAVKADKPRILDWGKSWEMGLKAGLVVDMNEAARSVATVLKDAESKVDFPIHSALIGITGKQLQNHNKQIWVSLGGDSRPVVEPDLKKLEDAAHKIGIPADQRIVQLIARSYLIDGVSGIQNPLGMVAGKLGMEANLIAMPAGLLENLKLTLEKAALEVESCLFVSQIMALGEMLLTEEEKTDGALVLDIGGELSQLALFTDSHFHSLQTLDLGGNLLSRALARKFDLVLPEAEDLKKKKSFAHPDQVIKDEELSLSSGNSSIKDLSAANAEALAPLLDWLKAEIETIKKHQLKANILVLTGGGALLRGLPEYLQQELGLPVKIGKAQGIKAPPELENSPRYHSALAILLWGARQRVEPEALTSPAQSKTLFHQLKRWVEEAFL